MMLTEKEKIKRNRTIIKQCLAKEIKLTKHSYKGSNNWYLVPLENVSEVIEMFKNYKP